jgi:branched-chain amino acid aminotransferase
VPTQIWIDGALAGADGAVPALDAGFLHGDSVFETLRTAGGRAVDLARHLDRLEAAGRALALEVPGRARLIAAVTDTIAAAGEAALRVRIIVTRGRTDRPGPPLVVVTAEPLVATPAPDAGLGLVLALVDRPLPDPRALDPSLKTGSYLPSLLALRDARAIGADEAVRTGPGGAIAEGATSNLFAVVAGTVVTPPAALGIRAGVTRARVLDLARAVGVAAAERILTPAALAGAGEVFITSSLRGIAAAGCLVDAVGDELAVWPAPGPVTARLAAAYARFLGEVARGGAG